MSLSLGLRKYRNDTQEEVDLVVRAFELGQQYLVDSFQKGEFEPVVFGGGKIQRDDLEGANNYFKRRANKFALNLARNYHGIESKRVEKMLQEKGYDTTGDLARFIYPCSIEGKDWIPSIKEESERPIVPIQERSLLGRLRSKMLFGEPKRL